MTQELNDKSKLNLKISDLSTASVVDYILPVCSMTVYLISMYKLFYYFLEKYESSMDTIMGKYLFLYIPYAFFTIVLIIVFTILYKIDKQFTHKYKINDHPWPWEEDPVKWKKQFPKVLKLYVRFFYFEIYNQ